MNQPQPGDRLKRWLRSKAQPTPVDPQPVSVFDHLVKARLDSLAEEVAEVKKLVVGLIAAIITAVLVSVVLQWLK